MSMRAPPWSAVGVLLVLIVLGGCLGPVAEIPDDRFYRLPDPAPAARAQPVYARLAVALPSTDGLHSERALLYVHAQRPLEILRHHYYFWADSPPRLLQEHLLEYLRRARAAAQLWPEDAAPADTARLRSRVLRFERVLGGDRPQVLVELELRVDGGPHANPWQRYRVMTTAADGSVYASVQAFGKALESIYARFLDQGPAG